MTARDSGIVIRPAVAEDLRAVVGIENEAFEDAWSVEALYGELLTDHMRLPLIAEYNHQVCGYIMAWRVADQLHVLNIATSSVVRRRGVGTALLLAAARTALDEGLTEITLEVRRSNSPARAFYHRYGFGEVGVRPGYYADNGEDAIIMTCRLEDLTDLT